MQLWHDLLVVADWDITVENCHQGQQVCLLLVILLVTLLLVLLACCVMCFLALQPPNATWCPFDSWRVGPDVNGIGPDNEILRVIAAMQTTFPR